MIGFAVFVDMRESGDTQRDHQTEERADSVSEMVASRRLNLTEANDVARVLDSDRPATGNETEVLYLGNSQVRTLVDRGPGDLTSAQWLQVLLDRKTQLARFSVRLGALDGMNLPEMLVRIIAAAEAHPRQVDIVIIAISPEQFRKLGVRDEMQAVLVKNPVRESASRLLQSSPDLSSAQGVLQSLIGSPKTSREDIGGNDSVRWGRQLDEKMVQYFANGLPFFANRDRFRARVAIEFMLLRNRALSISTDKPRPLPKDMYESDLQLLELIARYVDQDRIRLVLYLAPLRQREPNPYTIQDRTRLGNDVISLCRKYELTCLDYATLIPDQYFANVDVHDRLGRRIVGQPDFVHFVGDAHKIVAEKLMQDIGTDLVEWSGRAGNGR